MEGMGTDVFSGFIGLAIILFLLVLAILWFCLPFAIFGTKAKLDQLITEAKKNNASIQNLNEELKALRTIRGKNMGATEQAITFDMEAR